LRRRASGGVRTSFARTNSHSDDPTDTLFAKRGER
jgi:hypothetical protein